MENQRYFLKINYEKFNAVTIKKNFSNFGNPKNIKVLYLSTYNPNYTRTAYLLSLLKKMKIKYQTIMPGYSKFRYLKVLFNLIKLQKNFDIIFVAFEGHKILPFIKLFSKKPIIFDAFISIYDTLCFDRKIFRPESLVGRLLKNYDKFLFKISDFILLDTKTHMDYFIKEFKVPKNKISYLYVGCNKKLFKPIKIKRKTDNFIVFWYGNTPQLQGIDIILKAAKILEREKDICFHFAGPIKKKYYELVNKLDLKNVRYTEWIPYKDLPKEIATADLCLGGHFSSVNKAKRVIPGKVFQFIAMGKPIIIGDNPATRELFTDSQKTIFCKMNDEKALAETILLFKNSQKNLIFDKK